MVNARRPQLGPLTEAPADWQHPEPSRLLFVGPLQVPKFDPPAVEKHLLDTVPFAYIGSQRLDVQPLLQNVQGLQQGFVEELVRIVEGTKQRVGDLARDLREGLQKGAGKFGLVHMRARQEDCAEQDLWGKSESKLAALLTSFC
jgi:hypothetical protein